jgi:stress response protein YsnF
MSLEAVKSARPFPGARSQVPGFRREQSESTARQRGTAPSLPLGASALPEEGGWTIRLRVRAEQIEVEKQVVVRERVAVRRHAVGGLTPVTTDIRKEVLNVQVDGQAEISPPLRDDADDHGS